MLFCLFFYLFPVPLMKNYDFMWLCNTSLTHLECEETAGCRWFSTEEVNNVQKHTSAHRPQTAAEKTFITPGDSIHKYAN